MQGNRQQNLELIGLLQQLVNQNILSVATAQHLYENYYLDNFGLISKQAENLDRTQLEHDVFKNSAVPADDGKPDLSDPQIRSLAEQLFPLDKVKQNPKWTPEST